MFIDSFYNNINSRWDETAAQDWIELIGPLRSKAWAEFSQSGLPARDGESWRSTDLRKQLPQAMDSAGSSPVAIQSSANQPVDPQDERLIEKLKSEFDDVMVFIDGTFDLGRSKINSGYARPLSDLWRETISSIHGPVIQKSLSLLDGGDSTANLNLALLFEGGLIEVGKGGRVPRPIQLVHLSQSASMMAPLFNIFLLGAGGFVEVTEWYLGSAEQWIQPAAVGLLDQEAKFNWSRLVGGESLRHVGGFYVEQKSETQLSAVGCTAGPSLVRENWRTLQAGEGAQTRLFGTTVTAGRDHHDFHVEVIHEKPRGSSEQVFRSAADGNSRSVFNGKIYIETDAQEVQARQAHAGLLLSDGAEIDTRPELDVRADNVKANHGASVGQLDEEQIFYLRTRGLSKSESMSMLARGFAESLLDKIQDRAVRNLAVERMLGGRVV